MPWLIRTRPSNRSSITSAIPVSIRARPSRNGSPSSDASAIARSPHDTAVSRSRASMCDDVMRMYAAASSGPGGYDSSSSIDRAIASMPAAVRPLLPRALASTVRASASLSSSPAARQCSTASAGQRDGFVGTGRRHQRERQPGLERRDLVGRERVPEGERPFSVPQGLAMRRPSRCLERGVHRVASSGGFVAARVGVMGDPRRIDVGPSGQTRRRCGRAAHADFPLRARPRRPIGRPRAGTRVSPRRRRAHHD